VNRTMDNLNATEEMHLLGLEGQLPITASASKSPESPLAKGNVKKLMTAALVAAAVAFVGVGVADYNANNIDATLDSLSLDALGDSHMRSITDSMTDLRRRGGGGGLREAARRKVEEAKRRIAEKKARLEREARERLEKAKQLRDQLAAAAKKAADEAKARAQKLAEEKAAEAKAALERAAEARRQRLENARLLAEKAKALVAEKAAAAKALLEEKAAAAKAALEARAAEKRKPKGDCREAEEPTNTFNGGDGYVYATMGNTKPSAGASKDNDHGDAYLALPDGWDFVDYDSASSISKARKIISSNKWGVDQVCLAPNDLDKIKSAVKAASKAVDVIRGVAGVGAGVVGASAVAVGAGVVVASAAGVIAVANPVGLAVAGGVISASAVGGSAAAVGLSVARRGVIKKLVDDKFSAACFATAEKKWYQNKASYLLVKNGEAEKQCGYADDEDSIIDIKKDYFGATNWQTPTFGRKSRQYLIRKESPEGNEESVPSVPLVDEKPAMCPMVFRKGYSLTPPAGCAYFSKVDIGWEEFEEGNVMMMCGVEATPEVAINEDTMKSRGLVQDDGLAIISTLKAGPGAEVTFYSGNDFDGKSATMDVDSASFIHTKFDDGSKVNDKVKSFKFISTVDADIKTCEEYQAMVTA